MGYRDYFDKKPTLGQNNNALVLLFAINAFIFLSLIFLSLVYSLEYRAEADVEFKKTILFWFGLSSDYTVLLHKPWSIFVYAFSNISIIGFISNMLWLWTFGYILQDLVGNKKLIPVYLYGSFFGGLIFLIISSFQKEISDFLFLGSNTAIIAVAIATTTLSPKYKIFQHIGSGFSLWILALIFIVFDISIIANSNLAVAGSHAIAGLVGFIFIYELKKGRDWSIWMYALVRSIENLFTPNNQKEKSNKKIKSETNEDGKLNNILDKINEKGYDGLSQSDKEYLESRGN